MEPNGLSNIGIKARIKQIIILVGAILTGVLIAEVVG